MLQPPQSFRFEFKTPEHLGTGLTRFDDLEGDGSPRMFLLGLIDDTHSTFTDPADDPIPRNPRGLCGNVRFAVLVSLRQLYKAQAELQHASRATSAQDAPRKGDAACFAMFGFLHNCLKHSVWKAENEFPRRSLPGL